MGLGKGKRQTGVEARLVSYPDICERTIASSHFGVSGGEGQAQKASF